MDKLVLLIASMACLFLFGSVAPPQAEASSGRSLAGAYSGLPNAQLALPARVAPLSLALPEPVPPPPPPPTAQEALEGGVLVVVSIASQNAHVFRRGELWDSTPVSTGKPGNDTPAGTFPILQKKVHHRSTLYDDAPMPYMQRLTWDGVALHAGRVPGYPASHGCIRLPKDFAQKLYGITGFSSTVVVVTEEPVGSAKEARKLVASA